MMEKETAIAIMNSIIGESAGMGAMVPHSPVAHSLISKILESRSVNGEVYKISNIEDVANLMIECGLSIVEQ